MKEEVVVKKKPVTETKTVSDTVTSEKIDTSSSKEPQASGEVNTESNESESDLKDAGDKMKAGAKTMGAKMSDPDKDLDTQYQQKKAEEKASYGFSCLLCRTVRFLISLEHGCEHISKFSHP